MPGPVLLYGAGHSFFTVILDTAQAAAFASAVLLCVTLALNALALCAAAVCARKAADRA